MARNRTLPVRADDSVQANDEYEDAESRLPSSQQLASWLTSMVVHLALLLVLALIVLGTKIDEPLLDLTIDASETPTKVELTEHEPDNLQENSVDTNRPHNQAESVAIETEIEVASSATIPDPAPQLKPLLENLNTTLGIGSLDPIGSSGSGRGDGPLGGRGKRGRFVGPPGTGAPTVPSESAVEAALKWLAGHQNRDGSWSFEHTLGDRCSRFANPGDKQSRMGATGLALLPFLAAGYTHETEGKYKYVVKRGLDYLRRHMIVKDNMARLFEANGASHEHMYCHGIAACALAEAYGMTQDVELKAAAQLSINYIVAAQHPQNGGWMYTPRAGGDTSVVGWQIMALKSGVLAYLQVPASVKPLANRWLDSVQSDFASSSYGIGSRYGYRRAEDRRGDSSACTAIGLLCRNYLGVPKDDAGLRKGVRAISDEGPVKNDMYYNYYASMLMYQNDGKHGGMWIKWFTTMTDHLVASQVREGDDRGSWHFTGNHGNSGGRVYNTALACLTLEVPYRYLPIYQHDNVEKDDFPLE